MRWLPALLLFVCASAAQAQSAGDPYSAADRAFQAAMQADADREAALEHAARLLLEAVDGAPDDARAPAALVNAAVALDTVGRAESAVRVYTRIIEEVGPRVPSAADAESLDEILVNAYLRRARLRERAGDRERAFDDYRVVADSPRFRRSTATFMRERIDEAMLSAASLLAALHREADAARYFERLAERTSDTTLREMAREWLEAHRPTRSR